MDIIKVTKTDNIYADGKAIKMQRTPQIQEKIRKMGIKNNTCLDKLKNIVILGLPVAWK